MKYSDVVGITFVRFGLYVYSLIGKSEGKYKLSIVLESHCFDHCFVKSLFWKYLVHKLKAFL